MSPIDCRTEARASFRQSARAAASCKAALPRLLEYMYTCYIIKYTYIYTHTHIYIYAIIHMYIYIYVHACVHMRVYVNSATIDFCKHVDMIKQLER